MEARGDFAPRSTALAAYWTVVCRMPRSVVKSVLEAVLGIPNQFGEHAEIVEEAGAAVREPAGNWENCQNRYSSG